MSEKEEFSKLALIKSCPICGKKFGKGYIVTEGIRWDTSKHKGVLWSARRLGPRPIIFNNFPGLKCENCEIVILDYGSRKDNHG